MRKVLISFLVLAICSAGYKVVAEDDWWEYGHFYQIYPRSFQDSDGDGVGDLHGITMRLPYLKYIGVTGVWLSPIYQSPMADFGYDISDFKKIQPEYGTMEDFDRLVERCKELDIKLILDLVPNHSSNESEWFKKSANPSDPDYEKYKNYYIWDEGIMVDGKRSPPNNWLSIFRGPAWKWVESRQAYYYHIFLEQQPDLNYRNDSVVNEIKDVMRFWMKKGVSGFRCDAVPYLFEALPTDGVYPDEPLSGECSDDNQAWCYLRHDYTQDMNETFDMIYQWRNVTQEPEFADQTRILMTEAYTSLANTLRFYGKVENNVITNYGSQIPFNFELISKTSKTSSSYDFKKNIDNWINGMPEGTGIHPNWVLGNHDNHRLASRYYPERADLFNILLKTLPGITVTYQGEELGMTDVSLTWEETVDPQACRNPNDFEAVSRDPARTPFQWDDTANAGFSCGNKTWLKVAENFTECNVKLEKSQVRSHLKVFRQLMSIRQNPTIKYGGLEMYAVNSDVLIYKREISDKANTDVFVILLNLGFSDKSVQLSSYYPNLPLQMEVATVSIHSETLVTGIDPRTVNIPPLTGVVLSGRK